MKKNRVEDVFNGVDIRSENECWPWKRGSGNRKYGHLDIGGEKSVLAHRAAYLSANPGSITLKAKRTNDLVLHRCDYPKCCNPAHLFLGTHQDNMDDRNKKGRTAQQWGELSPTSKLTNEDVFWMRLQKKNGATINSLALLYGIGKSTASAAIYGLSFKRIQ